MSGTGDLFKPYNKPGDRNLYNYNNSGSSGYNSSGSSGYNSSGSSGYDNDDSYEYDKYGNKVKKDKKKPKPKPIFYSVTDDDALFHNKCLVKTKKVVQKACKFRNMLSLLA